MTTKTKQAPTDNPALRAWQLSLYETPMPHTPAPLMREPWPLDPPKVTLFMTCYDDGCALLTDDAAGVGVEEGAKGEKA